MQYLSSNAGWFLITYCIFKNKLRSEVPAFWFLNIFLVDLVIFVTISQRKFLYLLKQSTFHLVCIVLQLTYSNFWDSCQNIRNFLKFWLGLYWIYMLIQNLSWLIFLSWYVSWLSQMFSYRSLEVYRIFRLIPSFSLIVLKCVNIFVNSSFLFFFVLKFHMWIQWNLTYPLLPSSDSLSLHPKHVPLQTSPSWNMLVFFA